MERSLLQVNDPTGSRASQLPVYMCVCACMFLVVSYTIWPLGGAGGPQYTCHYQIEDRLSCFRDYLNQKPHKGTSLSLRGGGVTLFFTHCRPPTTECRRRHLASGGRSLPSRRGTFSEPASRSGSGSQRNSSSSSSSTASTAGEGVENFIIQVVEGAFTPKPTGPEPTGVTLPCCVPPGHGFLSPGRRLQGGRTGGGGGGSLLLRPSSRLGQHQLHCDCGELNQPLTEPFCQEMEPPSVTPGVPFFL